MRNYYGLLLLGLFLASCITQREISSLEADKTQLYPIAKNNHWGFADTSGNRVIPYNYEEVSFFSNGLAVVKEAGKYGFLKTDGSWHLKPQYYKAKNFQTNYAAVEINGKERLINLKGKRCKEFRSLSYGCIPPAMPVEPQEYIASNAEGMALIYEVYLKKEGKKGYEVIKDTTDYTFQSVQKYSRSCFLIQRNNKFGFYNPKYRTIQPLQPSAEYESFEFDRQGKKVRIDFKYDQVNLNYQDFAGTGEEYEVRSAEFRVGNLWGIVDSRGNEMISAKYLGIDIRDWRFAEVEYEPGLKGYIDYNKGTEYFKRTNFAARDTCISKVIKHDFPIVTDGVYREFWVSLPMNYDEKKAYPVMYVFDAEWRFDLIRSMAYDLSGNKKMPHHIIVGIPHIDWRTQRGLDLTFSQSPNEYDGEAASADAYNEKNTGGGPAYYQYLKEQVIPTIDQQYATDGQRILIGHSYGGYFCAYIMPFDNLFSAYQIYDPSAWYNEGEVVSRIAKKTSKDKQTNVFISYQPIPAFHKGKIEELITRLGQFPKIKLETKLFTEDTHNSLYMGSFLTGMKALYPDWKE